MMNVDRENYVVSWSRSDLDTANIFSRLKFDGLNVGFNKFFKEPEATGIVCIAPELFIYGGKLPVKVSYDDTYMTVRVTVGDRTIASIESPSFANLAAREDSSKVLKFIEDLVSSELFK